MGGNPPRLVTIVSTLAHRYTSLSRRGKKLREKAEGKLAEIREASEDLVGRGREAYSETAQGAKKAARSFTKS